MAKLYTRKMQVIFADQLGPDNITLLEVWTGGSIKGTALPVEQRSIDIWTRGREIRANMGDYIVREAAGFYIFTSEEFERTFVQIDWC
jgi:hypothetical protein